MPDLKAVRAIRMKLLIETRAEIEAECRVNTKVEN